MIIHSLKKNEVSKVMRIHEKFYPNDNFPDLNKLIAPITITEKEKIICFGGIELIAEGVMVTNKDINQFTRGKALLEMMCHMLITCSRLDQSDLHVFMDDSDEVWKKALEKYGFQKAGTCLYKKV